MSKFFHQPSLKNYATIPIRRPAPVIADLKHSKIPLVTFDGVSNPTTAKFLIRTLYRGNVRMKIESGNWDEGHRVVEVQADKFLRLWRADPNDRHRDVSHGDRMHWLNDKKFSSAEAGFLNAKEALDKPVPLAAVGCRQLPDGTPCVNISDGVTRTIWLLAYGASIFPVMCGTSGAQLLQSEAGLPNGRPMKISDLLMKVFQQTD